MRNFLRKYKKFISTLVIIVAVGIVILSILSNISAALKDERDFVAYTEFKQMVDSGDVDVVYYDNTEEYMVFALYNDETREMSEKDKKNYEYPNKELKYTTYPGYEEFRKDMLESNVRVLLKNQANTKITVIMSNIFTWVLMPFMFLIMVYMLYKSMNPDNRKNDYVQSTNLKFSDVIGQDEILDDIKFITELLKHPKKGNDLGVKAPKGILLSGPPGTGKTLIAKAIAGEAKVPFLYMNASGFKELFVGLGARRVRNLFMTAKQNAPCIVFIDEIDAVGGTRSGRGTNSEDTQTVNALLTEMDGFKENSGIFVIAATNRPDTLDPALIRAGRFDRQIVVNPPKSWHTRKELFEFYLKGCTLGNDLNIDALSKQTQGFTGADIAMVCNEAGMIALMHNKDVIDMDCIEEAIDKKVFKGNRSKKVPYKNDVTIVAYHESGHAVMTYLKGLPISRASIVGTTSGVGGAVFGAETESQFMTKQELEDRVMIAYAGRASEEIKFVNPTTGASNDITQATELLHAYVENYGFDEDTGLIDIDVLNKTNVMTPDSLFSRMSELSRDLYKTTLDELKKSYDKVELLAQELLKNEIMSGEEIEKLLAN